METPEAYDPQKWVKELHGKPNQATHRTTTAVGITEETLCVFTNTARVQVDKHKVMFDKEIEQWIEQ